MSCKKAVMTVVGILIVCNLLLISAASYNAAAETTYLEILNPIISVPVIQKLGEDITIVVSSDAAELSSWNLMISTQYDSFPLIITKKTSASNIWTLTAKVPPMVRADLYDLTVTVDDISDREHHSVSVVEKFKDKFSFIQMTDIHIKDSISENENNFLAAIQEVNLIHPELVIISGDIGDNPEGVGQDEEAQYQRVYDLLLKFDVPVYVVNGNHDYDSDLFEESPIHVYREMINPYPDFSFDYGKYHFVGLDSGEKNAPFYGWPGCMEGTGLTDGQIAWLESDLEAHQDSVQNFIFMHHTAMDYDETYAFGLYWSSTISHNRQELLDLTEDYNVGLVLTGHTHSDEVWDSAENKYEGGTTTSPALPLFIQTRAAGKADDGDVGYRLVRVNGTGVESYTYDLDDNGHRDAASSIPSGSLHLSFSPSNDGSSGEVTATVINDLDEDFQDAFMIFNLPKPGRHKRYVVENGSIVDRISLSDKEVYYVMTDLQGGSEKEVTMHQEIYDRTPPFISLIPPVNNPYITPGTILNFTVSDPYLTLTNYSINHEGPWIFPSPFDINTSGWEDGEYVVWILAKDAFGNEEQKEFKFTVDSTPPEITLNSPHDNSSIVSGTTIDLGVKDENPVTVDYYVNGISKGTLEEPCNVDTSTWPEGANDLKVRATDDAENRETKSFTFILDHSPPYVVSTYPLENGKEVDVGSDITIEFSEPMDSGSVEGAVLISPEGTSSDGWFSGFDWDRQRTTLTATLTSPLRKKTEYTVEIGEEAKDRVGIPMDSPYIFSFETWEDSDGDGIGDPIDEDDDNDGYNDEIESSEGTNGIDANSIPEDLDRDLIPDTMDADIDGDGHLNDDDAFPRDAMDWRDTDGDGIGDGSDILPFFDNVLLLIIIVILAGLILVIILFNRRKSPEPMLIGEDQNQIGSGFHHDAAEIRDTPLSKEELDERISCFFDNYPER